MGTRAKSHDREYEEKQKNHDILASLRKYPVCEHLLFGSEAQSESVHAVKPNPDFLSCSREYCFVPCR